MNRLSPTHLTVIIVSVLMAIVTLALFGRDTAALTGLLIAIAAGVGITATQQSEIRQNVNGNMAKLVDLAERFAHTAIDQARSAPPHADRDAA